MLYVGGHGYKHSCIQDQSSIDPNLAIVIYSALFADLTSETNTIQDLRVQARRLTLCSDWAAFVISGSEPKSKVPNIVTLLKTQTV